MKDKLHQLFGKSFKKATVWLLTVAAILEVPMDGAQLAALAGVTGCYLIGQGLADFGKGKQPEPEPGTLIMKDD